MKTIILFALLIIVSIACKDEDPGPSITEQECAELKAKYKLAEQNFTKSQSEEKWTTAQRDSILDVAILTVEAYNNSGCKEKFPNQ